MKYRINSKIVKGHVKDFIEDLNSEEYEMLLVWIEKEGCGVTFYISEKPYYSHGISLFLDNEETKSFKKAFSRAFIKEITEKYNFELIKETSKGKLFVRR